jgi:predicted transglutaminase-like cysteine proteinase
MAQAAEGDGVDLGRAIVIGAAGLLAAACTTVRGPAPPTEAAAPRAPFSISYMETGPVTPAPTGFSVMCQRNTDVCLGALFGTHAVVADRDEATAVVLTGERLAVLERVNNEVNTRIRSVSDKAAHGVEELWVDPLAARLLDAKYVAEGDCEDYAIAKRDALRATGWPPESMFLAVGYHQRYGLHVALVVRTNQGDLVLDSRSPWIRSWKDTPYIWTKRQLSGNTLAWVKPYAVTPEMAVITAAIEARARGGTAAR